MRFGGISCSAAGTRGCIWSAIGCAVLGAASGGRASGLLRLVIDTVRRPPRITRAEFALVDIEVLGKGEADVFIQAARSAAGHELLKIGRVAAGDARKLCQTDAVSLDQLLKACANGFQRDIEPVYSVRPTAGASSRWPSPLQRIAPKLASRDVSPRRCCKAALVIRTAVSSVSAPCSASREQM